MNVLMSGARNNIPLMGLPVITKHTIMANMTIHRIRLSKMQKVINVLAIASAAVSLAVVGTVGYVFVNRTAIIEDVKEKAMEAVLGGAGGLGALGGAAGGLGGDLPIGTPDLAPQDDVSATPQAPEGGFGVSQF